MHVLLRLCPKQLSPWKHETDHMTLVRGSENPDPAVTSALGIDSRLFLLINTQHVINIQRVTLYQPICLKTSKVTVISTCTFTQACD